MAHLATPSITAVNTEIKSQDAHTSARNGSTADQKSGSSPAVKASQQIPTASPTTSTQPQIQKPFKTSLDVARSFSSPIKSSKSSSSSSPIIDMVCVGFGPASLAIAIALADRHAAHPTLPLPRVLFLEKQPQFAWHSGMQLPEAKMQISFLKDLATPRDPTSPFSFVNYLQTKGRLNQFINLGTFLPARMEYEDYMRWCAAHFADVVNYGSTVTKVSHDKGPSGKVEAFTVHWSNSNSQSTSTQTITARHVVIAAGGRPFIPATISQFTTGQQPLVRHSSQYATSINSLSSQTNTPPSHIVVIGSGQSAAEIFSDLTSRFPSSRITLLIKGASLRPSDDSPFVNEIFDADRVDGIYAQSSDLRAKALALDRGTNYGVVRLELLERIYEHLYMQGVGQNGTPKENWRCRILTGRTVVAAEVVRGGAGLKLQIAPTESASATTGLETLHADLLFSATGYLRNSHEVLLQETRELLPREWEGRTQGFPVGRSYGVGYDQERVKGGAEGCGIWLQGCNEKTHGLSDTLLSILAIRGGEMVTSLFGNGFGNSEIRHEGLKL